MSSRANSDLEWQFWLRLMLTPGLGNESARRLLKQFGTPRHIFAESVDRLQTCVTPRIARALAAPTNPAFDEALSKTEVWLESEYSHFIHLGHSDYPPQLLEIPDPPTVLYVKGHVDYLKKPSLAIVGSRNASAQGIEHAHAFGRILSQSGWCISSGLAAGIDAAAHAGGLEGRGGTIAVIGTGVDVVYPARHRQLAHDVVSHGCIVSEYHLGMGPLAANFPRRNRIISGLAKGVLVVEAAEKSGSLITARMAAEQGRDVFAIPGSIHSPLARGCHQLIKEGAKLVENADDINQEYSGLFNLCSPTEESTLTIEADGLLDLLGYDPVDMDVLLARTKRDIASLSADLFTLEMNGQIEMLVGGGVRRLR